MNPWLLIPAIIMTALFYVMRRIFMNAGRSFIRVESLGDFKSTFLFTKFCWAHFHPSEFSLLLAYSPIFSHLCATLQGLPTVRAFNAGKMLEKEFHDFQNHGTACTYLFLCASTWFSLWMDVICLLFITSVTYSFLILNCKFVTILSNVNELR